MINNKHKETTKRQATQLIICRGCKEVVWHNQSKSSCIHDKVYIERLRFIILISCLKF